MLRPGGNPNQKDIPSAAPAASFFWPRLLAPMATMQLRNYCTAGWHRLPHQLRRPSRDGQAIQKILLRCLLAVWADHRFLIQAVDQEACSRAAVGRSWRCFFIGVFVVACGVRKCLLSFLFFVVYFLYDLPRLQPLCNSLTPSPATLSPMMLQLHRDVLHRINGSSCVWWFRLYNHLD